ncbi:mitochondrial 54S ribosomal protein YmL20 [Aspergillus flavus]|uniref:Mitochondrial 54S ribosomal protein YmL20 n=1 Tax=Aspergillus flavus TaxID=5059 RepID=A0AB74CAU9_ASPFL|nr:mitochondrial 54S ribosomal protein YmL20 [Aspergillus flavus]RAQ44008.1 mitochondrial 54S ribosomal protein YmL20 [Aspergillus flavus]RAQ64598.1 mitochondrial 54S ribosomal protein YmL20 [Aspergillus flavus]RAQ68802.1 mitochondrial 54S ribosomal protein YmL20 [Aspergillus flavus]RMZ42241.1 mitochondrial 54S ribosomal protein YmL20 [Aspergillus flavus]
MATCLTAPKRPFLALPSFVPSSCPSITLQTRRHQSSYRRTKQRLRVKPDASFGVSSTQFHDQIIHNPPSSAPSVYHTPTKFLPLDDVRRTLRGASMNNGNSAQLPSVFKTSVEKRYHLNPSDIEEIRRLRLSDPMTWSRWKLAKRFDCSPMFIAMRYNQDGVQNVGWPEKTDNCEKNPGEEMNEGGAFHLDLALAS